MIPQVRAMICGWSWFRGPYICRKINVGEQIVFVVVGARIIKTQPTITPVFGRYISLASLGQDFSTKLINIPEGSVHFV
jgi:hypothetical protein